MTLTKEQIGAHLRYDPETGHLYWRMPGRGRRMGQPAGTCTSAGYIAIWLLGRPHKAHRLARVLMTGEWPDQEIDHRDGNRANNRWENLRDATPGENQQNRAAQANSSSGLVGVSFIKRIGKWRAQISANGERKHIGCFNSQEEASAAYVAAKARLHPFNPTPRVRT